MYMWLTDSGPKGLACMKGFVGVEKQSKDKKSEPPYLSIFLCLD